jgi:hypothetical protein
MAVPCSYPVLKKQATKTGQRKALEGSPALRERGRKPPARFTTAANAAPAGSWSIFESCLLNTKCSNGLRVLGVHSPFPEGAGLRFQDSKQLGYMGQTSKVPEAKKQHWDLPNVFRGPKRFTRIPRNDLRIQILSVGQEGYRVNLLFNKDFRGI